MIHYHFAKIIGLVIGGVAAWQVYINLHEVFDGFSVPVSGAVIVLVVVYLLLYFPLLRPVADIIADRISALNQRMRSTRTGIGFDEIPQNSRKSISSRNRCGICGGPGGPVCESCRIKMSK